MMRKDQQDSRYVTMPEAQTANGVCAYIYTILVSQFDSQISDTQAVMITCEAARLPGISS